MRRFVVSSVAALVLPALNLSAQQNIYSRGDSGTGSWWHSNLPWYYQTWNNNQNRPDNDGRGNVEIGHNNNDPMSVNGAFFALRTLTFASGNNNARTLNASSGGGISLTVGLYNNSAGAKTFNVPIGVDAGTVAFQANNGTLSFTDSFYLNANTAAFAGGQNITVSGVMSGSGGFTKAGAGRIDLSGNNTFTGSSAINAGIARAAHNNAFGTTAGGVSVASGAMVELNNGITIGSEALTLNGDGGGTGALRSRTGATASWAGAITLGSASRINASSGGTLTLSGGISGAHNLTIGGDGGHVTISGAIATGTGSLTKDGTGDGILTLSAANSYSGATTIDSGTIRLGVANAIGDSSPVTVSSGAIFDLNNNADSIHSLAGAGNVTLGNATLTVLNGGTTHSGVISGTGGLTKQGTGTLTLTGNNTFSGALTISGGTVSLGDNGTSGTVAGNIVNNAALVVNRSSAITLSGIISGSGTLSKQGNSALTLSNVNTYNGDTTISAGSIVASGSANNSAFGVNSGATLAGAGSVGNATINGTVSPGNATGDRATLGVATLNLGSGGGYTFDISNVSGTPGTQWDLIDASGTINVNGSGTFTVFVTGNPTGFSAINPYSWVIMSGASVAGFNPARFAINTSGFTPDLAGGVFSVAQSGNTIVLEFTPPAVPAISVQGGTLAFGNQVVNTASSEQSYTVSGINLGSDPIVITAPSGFQVSTTSGSGFGSSVNLTPSGGTVNNTTIYARFVPNNVAGFSADITHTHTSAPTQNKAVTGTGTAPNNPSAFSAAAASSTSITLTFSLNAQSKPVVIVRNTDNNFTTPSGAPPSIGQAFAGGTVVYNGSSSPQSDTGLNGGTLYYYRAFSYDNVNGHFYSSGSSASATTIPHAPNANTETSRSFLGFTANWDAATGASSYRLDVSYYSDFSAMVSGYNNLTVNGTSQAVTVPHSGLYFYRVRAVNSSGTSTNSATQNARTSRPDGVNGGGSSPTATIVAPGTLYVGDNGTFAVRTWGDVEGNYSKWRVVIDTDDNILSGGIRGSWTDNFSNSEYKSQTSPRFTSAGTWYWGMQIDYGSPYGTNFWMVRDLPAWAPLQFQGTNVNLTVTVSALGDPTGISIAQDGTFPAERIDLGWSRWNNRNVMIVRSLDNVFTAPTPGQTYIVGNTIGGDTVVYNGSGTAFEDQNLSASTLYYYRLYSENFGYYSAGEVVSQTTASAPAPDAPVATAASGVGYTSFTANWNASAGATSYRIDVSRNAAFTDLVVTDHNPGNVTSYAVSGFGTGHFYYRVRAVNGGGTSDNSNTIEIGTLTAQTRNTGGGSPQVTAGTIYVGDTVTFGLDSWATLNGNFGRARVWTHTTASLGSGTAGSWGGFVDVLNKTRTHQMTAAGTIYWGIQMDYGSPYHTNFWYVRDSGSYHNMHYNPTGVTLTVTVTALGNPTGVSAAQNGGNPGTQIDLAWTKWNNRDVMVVRSTDPTFGTPTPGQVYSANDTISGDLVVYKGTGTSFTDTGLGNGTTYYYRYYSENFGYYSAGADANATTAGSAPPAPADQAATAVNTTSFQANWSASAGATGYRLDVSTANNFGSFVSGYNNLDVGNVTAYTVSGLTAGNTYYYRVRAYNGVGTSGNSGTRTVTLPASATVAITEIPPNGNDATVTFATTANAYYDVYYSDSDLSGTTNWTLYSTVQASGSSMTVDVPEDDRRYFKVVVSGSNPNASPSPVWGVIKPSIPSGYSMYSAPLDLADLTLSGAFGDALKEGLANGSQLHILEANGSFTTITLSGGNWNQNYTLAEGQGFFIENVGAPYSPRFAGPVGVVGSATRSINPGAAPTSGRWNIIGPLQGKTRLFGQVFATGSFTGTPTANWNQNFSDVIAIDMGGGVFKRIFRAGDGTWRDASTLGVYNATLHPGTAVYYFRYGDASLSITF